jgi:hypothetical protein
MQEQDNNISWETVVREFLEIVENPNTPQTHRNNARLELFHIGRLLDRATTDIKVLVGLK